MTTDLHVIMKFGEGKRGVGWVEDGDHGQGGEGRREGTRNTNHVDVKMNCCKLGRRSRRGGGRNEASSQGAHVHGEIDLQ